MNIKLPDIKIFNTEGIFSDDTNNFTLVFKEIILEEGGCGQCKHQYNYIIYTGTIKYDRPLTIYDRTSNENKPSITFHKDHLYDVHGNICCDWDDRDYCKCEKNYNILNQGPRHPLLLKIYDDTLESYNMGHGYHYISMKLTRKLFRYFRIVW